MQKDKFSNYCFLEFTLSTSRIHHEVPGIFGNAISITGWEVGGFSSSNLLFVQHSPYPTLTTSNILLHLEPLHISMSAHTLYTMNIMNTCTHMQGYTIIFICKHNHAQNHLSILLYMHACENVHACKLPYNNTYICMCIHAHIFTPKYKPKDTTSTHITHNGACIKLFIPHTTNIFTSAIVWFNKGKKH